MNRDLYLALLALDSYNRGLPASNPKLILNAERIGNATFDGREAFNPANGFYAASYTYGLETVISYRGTDFEPSLDRITDVMYGWSIAAGNFTQISQVPDTISFYERVTDKGIYDGPASNVVLTGHSLAGGLAALMSARTGTAAKRLS